MYKAWLHPNMISDVQLQLVMFCVVKLLGTDFWLVSDKLLCPRMTHMFLVYEALRLKERLVSLYFPLTTSRSLFLLILISSQASCHQKQGE